MDRLVLQSNADTWTKSSGSRHKAMCEDANSGACYLTGRRLVLPAPYMWPPIIPNEPSHFTKAVNLQRVYIRVMKCHPQGTLHFSQTFTHSISFFTLTWVLTCLHKHSVPPWRPYHHHVVHVGAPSSLPPYVITVQIS